MRKRKDTLSAVFMPALLSGIVVVFLICCMVYRDLSFQIFSSTFLSFAQRAVVALAIALTVRSGGADLSAFGWIGIYSAIIVLGSSAAAGLFMAIGAAILAGAFNGVLIAFAKAPGMIVTLAVGIMGNGLQKLIRVYQPKPMIPEYRDLLGKPAVAVIVFLVIAVLIAFAAAVLFTADGKASWNGLRKNKVKTFLTYIVSAILIALAAHVLTMRLRSSALGGGMGFTECATIAAGVLGMCAMKKRKTAIFAGLLPALTVSFVKIALVWMNVNTVYQMCVEVILMIVIVAVAIMLLVREKRMNKRRRFKAHAG